MNLLLGEYSIIMGRGGFSAVIFNNGKIPAMATNVLPENALNIGSNDEYFGWSDDTSKMQYRYSRHPKSRDFHPKFLKSVIKLTGFIVSGFYFKIQKKGGGFNNSQ